MIQSESKRRIRLLPIVCIASKGCSAFAVLYDVWNSRENRSCMHEHPTTVAVGVGMASAMRHKA